MIQVLIITAAVINLLLAVWGMIESSAFPPTAPSLFGQCINLGEFFLPVYALVGAVLLVAFWLIKKKPGFAKYLIIFAIFSWLIMIVIYVNKLEDTRQLECPMWSIGTILSDLSVPSIPQSEQF